MQQITPQCLRRMQHQPPRFQLILLSKANFLGSGA
jgi:hypothetical protein